jgi:hypothetical protein
LPYKFAYCARRRLADWRRARAPGGLQEPGAAVRGSHERRHGAARGTWGVVMGEREPPGIRAAAGVASRRPPRRRLTSTAWPPSAPVRRRRRRPRTRRARRDPFAGLVIGGASDATAHARFDVRRVVTRRWCGVVSVRTAIRARVESSENDGDALSALPSPPRSSSRFPRPAASNCSCPRPASRSSPCPSPRVASASLFLASDSVCPRREESNASPRRSRRPPGDWRRRGTRRLFSRRRTPRSRSFSSSFSERRARRPETAGSNAPSGFHESDSGARASPPDDVEKSASRAETSSAPPRGGGGRNGRGSFRSLSSSGDASGDTDRAAWCPPRKPRPRRRPVPIRGDCPICPICTPAYMPTSALYPSASDPTSESVSVAASLRGVSAAPGSGLAPGPASGTSARLTGGLAFGIVVRIDAGRLGSSRTSAGGFVGRRRSSRRDVFVPFQRSAGIFPRRRLLHHRGHLRRARTRPRASAPAPRRAPFFFHAVAVPRASSAPRGRATGRGVVPRGDLVILRLLGRVAKRLLAGHLPRAARPGSPRPARPPTPPARPGRHRTVPPKAPAPDAPCLSRCRAARRAGARGAPGAAPTSRRGVSSTARGGGASPRASPAARGLASRAASRTASSALREPRSEAR